MFFIWYSFTPFKLVAGFVMMPGGVSDDVVEETYWSVVMAKWFSTLAMITSHNAS